MRVASMVLCLVVAATPALAANARHPYSNIDRRIDAGNDTGDSQVDQLNRAQLDENFYSRQPGTPQPQAGGYAAPGYPMPAYPPPPYPYQR